MLCTRLKYDSLDGLQRADSCTSIQFAHDTVTFQYRANVLYAEQAFDQRIQSFMIATTQMFIEIANQNSTLLPPKSQKLVEII